MITPSEYKLFLGVLGRCSKSGCLPFLLLENGNLVSNPSRFRFLFVWIVIILNTVNGFFYLHKTYTQLIIKQPIQSLLSSFLVLASASIAGIIFNLEQSAIEYIQLTNHLKLVQAEFGICKFPRV